MTYDDYDEVTNSPETYNEIAQCVRMTPVIVGWTDEDGSHYDLLFAYRPGQFGNIGHGIPTVIISLFVGVIGVGCFAFSAEHHDTHPSYYAEKLGLTEIENSSTMVKLAELINGVRKALA